MSVHRTPLASLLAFHQHTLDQCEALWRLVMCLGQCEPDAASRQATDQLLAWFDGAGDAFANEERVLFPALIDSLAGADADDVRELTLSLTRRHRNLEALWTRLRLVLEAVAAGESRPEIIEAAGLFIRLMRRQIESEQETVVPLAHELIQEPRLPHIGDAVCPRAAAPSGQRAACT